MPNEVNYNITRRIGNFEGAIRRQFTSRKGKSNITKFQASILQSIRGNENIIIAHADTNLGPVGVDTTQCICWALDDHLIDTSTYVQVSGELQWTDGEERPTVAHRRSVERGAAPGYSKAPA